MKADKMWIFSDVLEKNKRVFKVPVYQRNYDWTNIQCEKLYQDIISASKTDQQHFIGTIVYINDGNDGSGLNEVLIIDGQQRITTVYILLKALYDAKDDCLISVKKEVEEVMFNRHCDEKNKVKLKPVKTDSEQLLLLINNKIDEMDRNSNVYKNYITFERLIKDSIKKDIHSDDILNGIKKLEIVEIILDKNQGDEPQKIFESINSTGLELSLADLIRNYLLMDDKRQDELYTEYWLEIEKNVGYQNLGDFVTDYLNSQITKSVTKENAYRLFKEYCETNKLSHEDILISLKRASKCYGVFIGEADYYGEDVTKCLTTFNDIRQTAVLPLFFKIFDDYENKYIDDKVLINILNYILVYFVRTNVCEVNKNMKKFMKSLYSRVIGNSGYDDYYEKFVIFLNDIKTNDHMPTDIEFENALINKPLYKKPTCKYLLSIIENSVKEHIDINCFTIEHILPQKYGLRVWRDEIGANYYDVYENYLHTLGNLTITGYNSELGTKAFSIKKKLIKDYSKATILNKDVLSADRWNKQAITNRAKVLAHILIRKFPYVDLHSNIDLDSESVFNLNSEYDYTNTKPSEMIFSGEHIKINSWAELLTKTLYIAYDRNPIVITQLANENYTIPSATRIYISNDTRKMRKPRQIGNTGIYYETNLSANGVVSFIRYLLIELQLDIDDFSFYLTEESFNLDK